MMKMLHTTLLSLLVTGITSASAQGVAIHPSDATTKCLAVRDGNINNATAVQIYDCDGSAGQQWVINHGNTTVQLAGQNFCLDASGILPDIGVLLWACDNKPQQQWNFMANGNIQVQNTNLCLDLPYVLTQNGVQTQTYPCTVGKSNQIWQV